MTDVSINIWTASNKRNLWYKTTFFDKDWKMVQKPNVNNCSPTVLCIKAASKLCRIIQPWSDLKGKVQVPPYSILETSGCSEIRFPLVLTAFTQICSSTRALHNMWYPPPSNTPTTQTHTALIQSLLLLSKTSLIKLIAAHLQPLL